MDLIPHATLGAPPLRLHGNARRALRGTTGLFVLLLLALAAAPSRADLIPVGETASTFNYVDPATVDKNGALRNVWVLIDYKEKAPTGAMSIRALHTFDCAAARYTMQSSFDYSEPRASGTLLRAKGRTDRWTRISPDSIAEAIGQMVCTK